VESGCGARATGAANSPAVGVSAHLRPCRRCAGCIAEGERLLQRPISRHPVVGCALHCSPHARPGLTRAVVESPCVRVGEVPDGIARNDALGACLTNGRRREDAPHRADCRDRFARIARSYVRPHRRVSAANCFPGTCYRSRVPKLARKHGLLADSQRLTLRFLGSERIAARCRWGCDACVARVASKATLDRL
jgi:hypothetical protein